MRRTFSHIVAMDRNRLIGKSNQMPWHLPNDLAWFKRNTMGKPIVMGRKTYQSIGRPLPGRDNIVITRRADFEAEGCTVLQVTDEQDLCQELLRLDERQPNLNPGETMIIGGAEIYRQTLPIVDKLYITRIEASLEGDAWYPEWKADDWELCETYEGSTDEKNKLSHRFLIYRRRDR